MADQDNSYTIDITGKTAKQSYDYMKANGFSDDDIARGHYAMKMPSISDQIRAKSRALTSGDIHGFFSQSEPTELYTDK